MYIAVGLLAVDTRLALVTNAVLVVVGTVAFLLVEWNAALGTASNITKPLTALVHSVSVRTARLCLGQPWGRRASDIAVVDGPDADWRCHRVDRRGVKLTTITIAIIIVIVAIVSTLRSDPETHLFRRRIAAPQVFLAMGIIALFLFAHFLLTLLLTYTKAVTGTGDKPFIDLMFETMSAAATVGPSTGITPEMREPGKLILCVAMFFGRIGPLTLAYAVTQRQQPARYRYPQGPVRIS